MKLFILILCIIIIPEPLIFLGYMIMKKIAPAHPLTLYLENQVNKIKIFFKKVQRIFTSTFQRQA